MEQHSDEFDTIIGPLEERLTLIAWRLLGDVHDAEDALQDAMTVVVRRWRAVTKHPNPQALVLKIVGDKACDHLRKRIREQYRVREASSLSSLPCDRDPSSQLSAHELSLEVGKALTALSANQRTAFILRYYEEQSYQSIGKVIGCKASTARKHVARARGRLESLLDHLRQNVEKTSARE